MLGSTKELIKSLRDEIEYLRKENTDLKDRVMAMVGDSLQRFKERELALQPVPPSSYVDHLGMIQRMEAVTDIEKKQKADAEKEMMELLGH